MSVQAAERPTPEEELTLLRPLARQFPTLDSAVAELDRRYLEGEGAAYAAILSPALTCIRAVDRRDWESFRECVAPEVVGRDHQWGLAEARGRDEIERIARDSMDAVAGSHLMVRRIHAVSNQALAVELKTVVSRRVARDPSDE